MTSPKRDQLRLLRCQIEGAKSKATQAQSEDDALAATVAAAELCMQALKLVTVQDERKTLSSECHSLLERAERLKDEVNSLRRQEQHKDVSTAIADGYRLKGPIPTRAFTTREQIILYEGSRLNGSIFPPWTSPPDPSEFDLQDGQALFIDDTEFQLSYSQLEILEGWRRPNEIFSSTVPSTSRTESQIGPRMIAYAAVDLVQDVTTDCSVVASLCAGTARAERGHPRMISSIMYPYDTETMCPILSRNGKYVFRLHFNGCYRRVTIDDRLPSSRTARSLHVIDRNNPALLWPALIEKAYLKVRGGYDFPGSNSGTDIWILTGWIPEQLFLQSDEICRDALWNRIFKAFNYGDLLVTMGTGKLTEYEEDGMGLAGQHDYAVLSMKEVGRQRLLLIKNPWSEGTIWKGSADYGSSSQALDRQQPTTDDIAGTKKPDSLSPGTFWMDLNDVFQSFESVYLNWNPALFLRREDIHFAWNLTASISPAGSFVSNPQYEVSSESGGEVWLLLSRHFKSRKQHPRSDIDKGIRDEPEERGFIGLYIYANHGERVFRSDGALMRGPYVDSPNILVKLDMPCNTAYTVVVSEQALARSVYNFTLSAFSISPIIVQEAREKYPHVVSQRGAWTYSSSGGNAGSSIYHTNPQFRIQLQETSALSLLLESENENYAVHVKVIWSEGKAVTSVKSRDVIGDSGEYRNGYAFVEMANVDAGTYTVVCSTFESGQLGRFSLRIASVSKCVLDRVQALEAGRLVSRLDLAFFTCEGDRLLAPLTLRRVTRLCMTAKSNHNTTSSASHSPSPIKLSLEYGQGPTKQVLSVSGNDEFRDGQSGVRTLDVDLQPRMCGERGLWIVIARLGRPGLQPEDESVEIEILSEAPVEVGKWGVGVG